MAFPPLRQIFRKSMPDPLFPETSTVVRLLFLYSYRNLLAGSGKEGSRLNIKVAANPESSPQRMGYTGIDWSRGSSPVERAVPCQINLISQKPKAFTRTSSEPKKEIWFD